MMRNFSFILLTIILTLNSSKGQIKTPGDTLNKVLKSSIHDTAKCKILNSMIQAEQDDNVWPRYNTAMKDLAEANLKKGDKTLENFYLKILSDGLNNTGYLAHQLGKPGEALEAYTKCLEIYKKVNNKQELAVTLNNIGGIYNNAGDIKKTLEYYYNSLKLREETDDTVGTAVTLINIALLHNSQGDYGSALKLSERAFELCRQTGNKPYQARALSNIALVYFRLDSIDKALKYYQRSLEISTEINNKSFRAHALKNIGTVYVRKKNIDEGLKYYKLSTAIYEEINEKRELSFNYCHLGRTYLLINEDQKAEECAQKALKLAQELGYPLNIAEAAILLKQVYEKLNKNKEALKMLELHMSMKDSLYNQRVRNEVFKKQTQYEVEKKEQEIKLLESENLVLKEKAEKKNVYILLVASFAVFFMIIILLTGRYRKKKEQIETARNKAEFELQALMSQMNPHFIFNALNSIQHFILEKGKQEAYDYLAKFSKLIRLVLDNSEDKMVSLQKELELIGLYIELEQLRFVNGFSYNLKIGSHVDPEGIDLPSMLLQPYVENAIWHGLMNLEKGRKGILKIDIDMSDDKLKISIEDNGVGRVLAKQFAKDELHRPVGMKLSERRLQMINKMKGFEDTKVNIIDLPNNQGTIVEIVLPMR